MKKKFNSIVVLDNIITVTKDDYISLTDMLKAKDGDFFISDWLRNRNTVEYLGIWERIHNPNFNYGEFAVIKSNAGLNSYKISVKEWVQKTNAIGLTAKAGRYGGTYAHKDIAFEFGMWISAEFKIYLVKEFQRLKDKETNELDWNIKRSLTKINYRIHTDAIKQNLIPPNLTKQQISFVYANEADVLNMALFGKTAKEWREENPDKTGNIRNYANVTQLVCLANLENLNAVFIIEKTFNDLCSKIGSGKTPKGGADIYQSHGIPFIRSQNVIDNNLVPDSTCIPYKIHEEMSNTKVLPNDILLNITGGSIGRSCVVPITFKEGNVNQHVCIIRLKKDNPKFLQTFLSSWQGQKLIFQGQTGSGREGLNFASIKSFKSFIPQINVSVNFVPSFKV